MRKPNRGWWLMFAAVAGISAAADETEHASRSIYRCSSGEAVVFSDRPCAAGAEVYAPSTPVNTYEPPKTKPQARTSAPARPRPDRDAARQAAAQAKLAETCRRIQQSLRDIRAKMRAGYGAKEGERLRDRQTKLERQRRESGCR